MLGNFKLSIVLCNTIETTTLHPDEEWKVHLQTSDTLELDQRDDHDDDDDGE